MAITDYVDLYCERTQPGLWAEPLNAATNLGFWIAGALLIVVLSRSKAAHPLSMRLLPVWLLLIGAGSLAFHTLATVWAGWLDTGFILVFACAFVYAFVRHVARWTLPFSWLATVVFFITSFGAKFWWTGIGLNGSEAYFPMVLGLAAMTFYLRRQAQAFRPFLLGTALLCISIALRTIDQDVCERFASGTHFMWHLMNAVILYLLGAALVRWRERSKPA